MFYFFLIFTLNSGIGISVEATGGILNTKTGNVRVGPGTFIPSPHDKTLAKKIVDRKTEIKILKTRIGTLNEKVKTIENYWMDREEQRTDFYESRYKLVKIENEWLKGFWNRYGKILTWCGIVAAGAAALTYGVCHETELCK